MPALNFHKQFAGDVAIGKKRQTIRATGKRAWKIGDTLHFFTGMRTAHCKRLGSATLLSVQQIHIDCVKRDVSIETAMHSSGRCRLPLFNDEILELAQADGFSALDEFFEFFQERHGRHMNGYLLKW